MSYSRKFTRRIAVHYSGSVSASYPASQNGGTHSVSYSGTAYEDVEVDIEVDTSPFDSSIASCNSSVNALTTSVAAMNAAQCLSIKQNTDKIAQTIIDGFFSTVKTDLSTQRAELEQAIQARLMLLHQQAQSLREMQQKMEKDYARTSARYEKIFTDLNKELSVRIHQVDQPVFDFVKQADTQHDRMLHTDMVHTPLTMGKESSTLQAQINAATLKRHALDAMDRAKDFLVSKAVSEKTIKDTTIDGTGEDRYMVPVCYIRTESENRSVDRRCHFPERYSEFTNLEDMLCNVLDNYQFQNQTDSENSQVKSYIQSEIAAKIPGNDPHSNRVRAMINKMINK